MILSKQTETGRRRLQPSEAPTIAELKRICDPFYRDHLECDGMTRILHSVLVREDMSHQVYQAVICGVLHFWIEIERPRIKIDYTLGKWFPTDPPPPLGVFLPTRPWDFRGRAIELPVLPEPVIELLLFGPL